MARRVDGTPKKTTVRSVRHDGETRSNIPTAELRVVRPPRREEADDRALSA